MNHIPARQEHAQAVPEVWHCRQCGNTLDAMCGRPGRSSGCRIDDEMVIARLEQAGATLLAMRLPAPGPGAYRCALPEVVREFAESYGWSTEPIRAAIPSAIDIARMEIVLGWLALIPSSRYVVRRIVAARCLVYPLSGRHVSHWRRLSQTLHCDYRACQRWHSEGISIIVGGLRNA